MAKDTIAKAIEVMLMGTPAGIARSAPKKIQNLIKKTMKEKKITGKPKGKSPSMVLGSASKAGMQDKQGKRPRPTLTPRLGPPLARKKTNGRRGSMVENFRKNKKAGKRG